MKREKGTADFRCSFCIYASKTISRVLYLTVIYLDAPLPVRSSHPGSGRASLGARSPRSHTGVAPDRVYSDGLFPAIECALTALFHPYLVITSSISFRIPRPTPVTPKRTQQSGSFRKRRRSGMSAPCRVRRGKGYEACDDEAVYLCCTFPEVAFGGRYPLFLPCGARTFLMDRLSPLSPRPSDLLTQYNIVFCGGSQRGGEDFIGKKN